MNTDVRFAPRRVSLQVGRWRAIEADTGTDKGRPESRPSPSTDSTSLSRSGDLKQRLQDRWSLLVLVERAQLHREQRSGP